MNLGVRSFLCALALAGSICAQQTDAMNQIEGIVQLPPARPAPAIASRYKIKAGAIAKPEPPRAVVYLDGLSTGKPTNVRTNQILQKGYQFSPAILPIQVGSSVQFPNRDDDYHHVFSYSKAREFDLGRYLKTEEPRPIVFNKPGVVKVGCEIHDHMRAVILVLNTPCFTVTDSQGKYRLLLQDVPPGKYTLKAWINEKITREQPVEIKPGASLRIDFAEK